ncbi:MAG: hypothetical protein J7549_14645 [Variovorax sp.]|nr:hypothetical protein [Variovorax sp.]
MKPVIEIRRLESGAYAYRVTLRETGGRFASVEQCLVDAAATLAQDCAAVELNFEGLFLGACAVEALRRTPRAVAQRIEQHFQPA